MTIKTINTGMVTPEMLLAIMATWNHDSKEAIRNCLEAAPAVEGEPVYKCNACGCVMGYAHETECHCTQGTGWVKGYMVFPDTTAQPSLAQKVERIKALEQLGPCSHVGIPVVLAILEDRA